jgi:response regulator RpfG family c-di-GMP phosphodiesterase
MDDAGAVTGNLAVTARDTMLSGEPPAREAAQPAFAVSAATPAVPSAEGAAVERPRVLCVDDEPSITASVTRVLRRTFDVVTAHTPEEGLALLKQGPAFAVVISDFQMPGMDGAEFLRLARQVAPDTVRVLLTGRRDLGATVDAVNHGQIFRFLAKPPAPEMLIAVTTAAARQYRLVTAERVLLEETLHGSIKALISLLALVQPAALGRTSRLKRHVSALAEQLQVPDRWSVEIATLLSQVGCVTLPPATMDRLAHGEALTPEELVLVARLPAVAETLIAGIPRLETVRAILRFQDTHFDGTGSPEPRVAGEAIPLGARILKAAIDFDVLESQNLGAEEALTLMGTRGWYDPAVLAAARAIWTSAPAPAATGAIRLSQVTVGMVFAADLLAPDGMLLAARGQEVTPALADRVRFDWDSWADSRMVTMSDRVAA